MKSSYFITALTIWLFVSIIYIMVKTKALMHKNKIKVSKIKGRQSVIHELVQNFLPSNEDFIRVLIARQQKEYVPKQSRQKYNPKKIKVVVVDDSAYWIQNNTFYKSIISEDGEIDQNLAIPIDTTGMQNEEIEKLMRILDDLRGEDNAGSGSSD